MVLVQPVPVGVSVPQVWVEESEDGDTLAAMVTLTPDLSEAAFPQTTAPLEFVFLVDRSSPPSPLSPVNAHTVADVCVCCGIVSGVHRSGSMSSWTKMEDAKRVIELCLRGLPEG